MAKQIGLFLPNGISNNLISWQNGPTYTEIKYVIKCCVSQSGEASVVQDCSAWYLAFSSVASHLSWGKNKMNQ